MQNIDIKHYAALDLQLELINFSNSEGDEQKSRFLPMFMSFDHKGN